MTYESPAKLNLSLLVHPRDESGMHPIESLVQTIDLLDTLRFEEADEDSFVCEGAELDPDDNLVVGAVEAVRSHGRVPTLAITLEKTIPIEAGLGGGSSNAAVALLAAVAVGSLSEDLTGQLAPQLGADVSLFLQGGTQLAMGLGEKLERQAPLEGFAVAVVVPHFGLATADVYRKWDELGEPRGEVVPDALLPPSLRGGMPIRNDLTPAALVVEPALGDFMADVRDMWDVPVMMTGSGSACFGLFGDVGEAAEAAAAVAGARHGFGVALRSRGVARVEPDD